MSLLLHRKSLLLHAKSPFRFCRRLTFAEGACLNFDPGEVSLCLSGNSFLIPFSVLLPLINPLGSALVFLGLVGEVPTTVFRSLARRIAISDIILLVESAPGLLRRLTPSQA